MTVTYVPAAADIVTSALPINRYDLDLHSVHFSYFSDDLLQRGGLGHIFQDFRNFQDFSEFNENRVAIGSIFVLDWKGF